MGKPLNSPGSIRPISLISCVSKLFEHIILSSLTPFFLPARSIFVLDNLPSIKFFIFLSPFWMGLTIPSLALRPFSLRSIFLKAFDSVWHLSLFHKLISAGLLSCFVGWTWIFFFLRGALVWHVKIKQVIPFKSVEVLCNNPFLFLFSVFINDLHTSLLLIATLLMLTSWTFGSPRSLLLERQHKELWFDWALVWALASSSQSEETWSLFSVNPRPAHLQRHFFLFNSPLRFSPTPAFFGATFDAFFPFLHMYLI